MISFISLLSHDIRLICDDSVITIKSFLSKLNHSVLIIIVSYILIFQNVSTATESLNSLQCIHLIRMFVLRISIMI